MTPPVLIDVNNDQIEDIIIPLYNSTLFAFDGKTFRQLWNKTFPSSETYRSVPPAVILLDSMLSFLVRRQWAISTMMTHLILWFITKLDPGIRCITVLR